MSEKQKSAQRKPAKRTRPEPDTHRAHGDDPLRMRRALCSLLRFWQFCGHKPCRRAQACAHSSNECFERFWPLMPEQAKHSIRAGVEAGSAGLSAPEIAAAIMRAQARWRDTQALPAMNSAAPPSVADTGAPPHRTPVPARAMPRIRVL